MLPVAGFEAAPPNMLLPAAAACPKGFPDAPPEVVLLLPKVKLIVLIRSVAAAAELITFGLLCWVDVELRDKLLARRRPPVSCRTWI